MVNPRLAVTTFVLAALALTACGSDDGSTPATSPPAAAATSPTDATNTTDPDAGFTPLTGAQICDRLTVDTVAADTGLDVTNAVPDDSGTPQCAYDYVNSTGGISNLTVASMRPEDVGDLSGSEAFDYVVQINKSIAGDDVDEQEVSAGDDAVRLSGETLHLGVLQVGDQILTLIVPADAAKTDAVDSLISTMATALG